MSYYSNNSIDNFTTFTVNFSQSYIQVFNDTSCAIVVGNVSAVSPYCSCSGSVCTFKPNVIANASKPISIIIKNIRNPFFIAPQILNITITFSTYIEKHPVVTIPPNNYVPMPIIVNSVSQSDDGVGSTPVTYTLNISLLYISQNMQMQVLIPPEVSSSSTITTYLEFYSNVQNIVPVQAISLLIFNLQVSANSNPKGYMLLQLGGMGNPTFLGSSTSFKITFIETTALTNCGNCKIAEWASDMVIESSVAGDVIGMSISSTNYNISEQTILSINL
jgi:hypothetical protein